MMMDCPRCGFNQPKDRYCASCGVDVEQLLARPKPLWVRIAQNPNTHLTLIGVLIILVVAYILRTQSELVSREMEALLDLPLSSREAGEPATESEDEEVRLEPTSAAVENAATEEEETDDEAGFRSAPPAAPAAGSASDVPSKSTSAAKATPESAAPSPLPTAAALKQIDMSFWETARETVIQVIAIGEKVGESNGGRAYLFPQGKKVLELVEANSRRLGLPRTASLTQGSQLVVETPPTASEAFVFGILLQITQWTQKEATFRWESMLNLPQADARPTPAGAVPTVRAVVSATLSGSSTLGPEGVLMIVIEPIHRNPPGEYVQRAGSGPWTIFESEAFRGGQSEWVALVQLK
ncbi:MAG: hypothetical protein AB7G93_18020 [Bdellovibrionales bacterium]